MKTNIFLYLIILFCGCLFLFVSCSEDSPTNDGSAPKIESITPNPATRGQEITITGTNFGIAQGYGFVDFNGKKPKYNDYIAWNSTIIKVFVPQDAVTGNVTVNVDGKISNAYLLNIQLPEPTAPAIDSINPITAVPGTVIDIFGKNFGSSQGQSYVEIGGQKAAAYSLWTDNKIKAAVSTGAKTGKIIVTANGKNSNAVDIIILDPNEEPAIIDFIDPIKGQIGQSVSLYGKKFGNTQGSGFVEFNGVKAVEYAQWSDLKIVLKVPPGATTGKVLVNKNGKISNSVDFTVTTNNDNPPLISYIDNTEPEIGAIINISGSYFGANQGSGYVDFNGTKAVEYNSWSDTKITVKVPTGATSGLLYVNANGKQSNGMNFKIKSVTGDPLITGIDNQNPLIGSTIGVYGKNFGSVQNGGYVEFNGVKAIDYSSWSDALIRVKVPVGTATGKLYVITGGKKSNGIDFTIQGSFKLLQLVSIPAGSFMMGGNDIDNQPIHKVTLSPFEIGKYEITQKEWMVVMDGDNPSRPEELGDNKPVNQVKFIRAILFCNRLSKMEKLDTCYTINGEDITCNFAANGYRLPTEAEWEYAARAGKTNFTEAEILEMAWTAENANKHTQEVGKRKANNWGIYDMFGNLLEMCWDYYDEDYYSNSPENDPKGPSFVSTLRVSRGGSYDSGWEKSHPAVRNTYPSTNENYNYNLGFRVVKKK